MRVIVCNDSYRRNLEVGYEGKSASMVFEGYAREHPSINNIFPSACLVEGGTRGIARYKLDSYGLIGNINES